MKKFYVMLSIVAFSSYILYFAGCNKQISYPPAVVLTLYWNASHHSEGEYDFSISGHLLTNSSSTEAVEPSQIKMISGTIENTNATGYALYTGSSTEQPIFSVLRTLLERDGKSVTVLSGCSSVKWTLEVEGTYTARIHDDFGREIDISETIPSGPFYLTIVNGEDKRTGAHIGDRGRSGQ